MKKTVLNILLPVLAAGLSASCENFEKLSIEDVSVYEPVILSISPLEAPVGAVVTVTGENLSKVTGAKIGDVDVTICEKVSDSMMSVKVGSEVKSGKVSVSNIKGSATSAETFTRTYVVPAIEASLLAESTEMGDDILISGTNFNSVDSVMFTAIGYSNPHKAAVKSRNDDELVVRVPYVETDKAKITLCYFDGSKGVSTDLASAPQVGVIRYVPEFNSCTFTKTAVGRSIELTGTHLDKVDRMLVGGYESYMTKTENTISFVVPAGEFPDGETVTKIEAEYFDGFEKKTLSDAFTVYVPYVKFWENITTSGHSRSGPLCSFFSPETGKVYPNINWRDELDPIAFKYQAQTCSATNVPAVTEEEYNSVPPYFHFYCTTANIIQITSPAGSATLFKNMWAVGASGDANRLPGGNFSCYGTPALIFRYLDPGNATEKKIVDMVTSGNLEKIDEATFPIDLTEKKVAGVSISSASTALKDELWAASDANGLANPFGDKKSDCDADLNSVVLVIYFDYTGGASANRLEHVKRLGLLNVKHVKFRIDPSNSSSAAMLSEYTFNCYWQKYDYDYSKLAK